MKKGGTAAAAGSIVFALIFNILLFVAAPLLLTNALFIGRVGRRRRLPTFPRRRLRRPRPTELPPTLPAQGRPGTRAAGER